MTTGPGSSTAATSVAAGLLALLMVWSTDVVRVGTVHAATVGVTVLAVGVGCAARLGSGRVAAGAATVLLLQPALHAVTTLLPGGDGGVTEAYRTVLPLLAALTGVVAATTVELALRRGARIAHVLGAVGRGPRGDAVGPCPVVTDLDDRRRRSGHRVGLGLRGPPTTHLSH